MNLATDSRIIDKLVDNELDADARAELIRTLDETPDGWKRCALAFLEAQAWGQSLSTASRDAAECGGTGSNYHRPPGLLGPVARRLLALAAAVVVAFGAGFVSRGVESHRVLIRGEATGFGMTDRALASTGESTSPQTRAVTPPPDTVPYVPERVRLQLERQGYHVTGDRKLVPIALGDGRKVAVPVDTVSYRYVGQRIQ